LQHGLGEAEELHTWVTDQDPVDTEILEGATTASGAVVMGRRLFDVVDGPYDWTEDMGTAPTRWARLRSRRHALGAAGRRLERELGL
jgi:hypothetical protein